VTELVSEWLLNSTSAHKMPLQAVFCTIAAAQYMLMVD